MLNVFVYHTDGTSGEVSGAVGCPFSSCENSLYSGYVSFIHIYLANQF